MNWFFELKITKTDNVYSKFHKNSYCQPAKESICFKLSLYTHNEDHFHRPQILKLAFGTHTGCFLNRDRIYQSQTPIITQSYQPNQMQNEIPLPYYLQQHEIKKKTHKFFSDTK